MTKISLSRLKKMSKRKKKSALRRTPDPNCPASVKDAPKLQDIGVDAYARGLIEKLRSTKLARTLVALALVLGGLGALATFITNTFRDVAKLQVAASTTLLRTKLALGALMRRPLDLDQAMAAYPAEFLKGALFHREIVIRKNIELGSNPFKFTAPKLLIKNNAIINRHYHSNNNNIILSHPKPQLTSHQFDALVQYRETPGLPGRNGESSGSLSIDVGELEGNLTIDNSGQNGQGGGPGSEAGQAWIGVPSPVLIPGAPVESSGRTVELQPGLAGRGGDGGNAGSVSLEVGRVVNASRILVVAWGGFGGSPGPAPTEELMANQHGGDGNSGAISIGGGDSHIRAEGAIECEFAPLESSKGRSIGRHLEKMDAGTEFAPEIYDEKKMAGRCITYKMPILRYEVYERLPLLFPRRSNAKKGGPQKRGSESILKVHSDPRF